MIQKILVTAYEACTANSCTFNILFVHGLSIHILQIQDTMASYSSRITASDSDLSSDTDQEEEVEIVVAKKKSSLPRVDLGDGSNSKLQDISQAEISKIKSKLLLLLLQIDFRI